jgi:hypothetical protein
MKFDQLSKKEQGVLLGIVKEMPNLARKELAFTICENLRWETPGGKLRVDVCLALLAELDATGIIKLAPLRAWKKTEEPTAKILMDVANKSEINGLANKFNPRVRLALPQQYGYWNDLIDRYHYLGYKRNFGQHLKYFIDLDSVNEPVGCISFCVTGSLNLASRDKYLEWSQEDRNKRIWLVINNNRFVIFPWVKVKNLGSMILSAAAKQITSDWKTAYGYEPVVIETFVDTSFHKGKIYKASNWIRVGQTSARRDDKTPKDIYLHCLYPDYIDRLRSKIRAIKKKGDSVPPSSTARCVRELSLHRAELDKWEQLQLVIFEKCKKLDETQFRQSRRINAITMIMAIFRIAFAKNHESYSSILCELVDHANAHGISLAFGEPIAPSTFTEARYKIDPEVFREIGAEIIKIFESRTDENLWFSRRIFGVDGSKINVHRDLMNEAKGGYILPGDHAFRPQGLISSILNLKTKMCHDFSFTNTMNELVEALKHLEILKPSDVVVYDRGYISYAMLYRHHQLQIDGIFRIHGSSFAQIADFMKEGKDDEYMNLEIKPASFRKTKKIYPFITENITIPVRIMRYSIKDKYYYLLSTITDSAITIDNYRDAYHGRWGHEESYKTLKTYLGTTEFHGKCEQFVKQELYAAFNILDMNRALSNTVESRETNNDPDSSFHKRRKVNTKAQLDCLYRMVEPIIAGNSKAREKALNKTAGRSARNIYSVRQGRSAERVSHKRINKWQQS